jgi:hypothetical protein
MKRYLTAAQVAELAELLEDAPFRVGVVEQVLQAAEQRRGMTLRLRPPQRQSTVRPAAPDRAPIGAEGLEVGAPEPDAC